MDVRFGSKSRHVHCNTSCPLYPQQRPRKRILGNGHVRVLIGRSDRGGIQYVEHAEGHGDRLFDAACKVGLEGIVSKKLDAPYRSGKSKTRIKVKNPKAPAATRAQDGTF